MAYATQQDIVTLYSQDVLYVADRDNDGVPDAEAITRALDSATSEIDSHVGARYSLPLPEISPLLVQYCVDIAIYRLANARDVLTNEIRTRYEDTIAALKGIAKGTASLNLPGPVDPDTGENTAAPRPRPIVSGGPEREFTREKLRGL